MGKLFDEVVREFGSSENMEASDREGQIAVMGSERLLCCAQVTEPAQRSSFRGPSYVLRRIGVTGSVRMRYACWPDGLLEWDVTDQQGGS